jgi:hypothetical protein
LRAYDRLVHATQRALERSMSFTRNQQVHNPTYFNQP